jgi:hypothetical protein
MTARHAAENIFPKAAFTTPLSGVLLNKQF